MRETLPDLASSASSSIYIILLISPICFPKYKNTPIHFASIVKLLDCASMRSLVLLNSIRVNVFPNGRMVIQFQPSGVCSDSPCSTMCHHRNCMTRCIGLLLPLPMPSLLRRLVSRRGSEYPILDDPSL